MFNAGKEIEASKRLTLHRMASWLYRFIASVAQLCLSVLDLFGLVRKPATLLSVFNIVRICNSDPQEIENRRYRISWGLFLH